MIRTPSHDGLRITAHVLGVGIVAFVNVDVAIGRHAHNSYAVLGEPAKCKRKINSFRFVVVMIQIG